MDRSTGELRSSLFHVRTRQEVAQFDPVVRMKVGIKVMQI